MLATSGAATNNRSVKFCRADVASIFVGFEESVENACTVWRTAQRRKYASGAGLMMMTAVIARAATLLMAGQGLQQIGRNLTPQLGGSLVMTVSAAYLQEDTHFNFAVICSVSAQAVFRAYSGVNQAHQVYQRTCDHDTHCHLSADQATHLITFSMGLILLPLLVKFFMDPPVCVSMVVLFLPCSLFTYHAPPALSEIHLQPVMHLYVGLMCFGILFLEYNVRCKFLLTMQVIHLQEEIDGLESNTSQLQNLLQDYRTFTMEGDDGMSGNSATAVG